MELPCVFPSLEDSDSEEDVTPFLLSNAPQLLGLDSLAGLDLGGLLQRLASRPRDTGSQASLRGLELPPAEELFADLDPRPVMETVPGGQDKSGCISAESLSEPAGSNPSTGGTNTPAAGDAAGPFLSSRKHRKTRALASEPGLPTVFIDVRPGRLSGKEDDAQSEPESEELSSASEGELASMSAEWQADSDAKHTQQKAAKGQEGLQMEFQLPARIKLPEVQNTFGLSGDNNASTKGQPWTEDEHIRFLQGLNTFGKGKWRQIARTSLLGSKTPTQVASHAQKYFSRQNGKTKRASRFTSIELNVQRNEAARATIASSAKAATSVYFQTLYVS
ncbi:hypothetical protein WJX73_003112 [Symbiochloris irregularis]|uniref:Uncharacterized protein n=1 Tax=Symbiochloris irregularis TaxID=706552 RepID=A0AAW1NM58_9CHLO